MLVYCTLAQIGAVWCNMVQTGATWWSLVHVGALWCKRGAGSNDNDDADGK